MVGNRSGERAGTPAAQLSEAWTEYLRWNSAVADVVYPVTEDPIPAYMDLEDDELGKIAAAAGYEGTDAVDALSDAIRAVTIGPNGKFGLETIAKETRHWGNGGLNRPGNPGDSWPWKRGCRYVHGIVIGKEADQSQV